MYLVYCGKKKKADWQDLYIGSKQKAIKVHFDVHNVCDYGVPQSRKRFTLVANRVIDEAIFPAKLNSKPITVSDVLGEQNGFPKISHGHKDTTPFIHTVQKISSINAERLQYIKKTGYQIWLRQYRALAIKVFYRQRRFF
ncbi:DNA cytosine methyltransferase [Niabella hibiscisoli]|uniref:DNA cytosine methyltransferase n=1 Tax=Niabella hibiscisoli TaxID=1825928 RepID=UPI00374DE308